MDTRSVGLLQFDFIIRELKSFCLGPEGEDRIDEQDFLTDRSGVDALLDRVDYIKRLIESDITPPEISLPRIGDALARVRVEGTAIDGELLAGIAGFIRSASSLNRYVSTSLDGREQSPLAGECAGMPDLQDISRFIFSQLEEDGTVKDSLPELRAIRRKLQNTLADINTTAAEYLRKEQTIWQTNVPTQKDDRLVLPLKADHRGEVKGLIRDISSSGATIFIEPFDLVEKNNEYTLLQNDYRVAVTKILRSCTEKVRERRDELLIMLEHTAYVDSVVARARFAVKYHCSRAEAMEKGFRIRGGRHPMLGVAAVPIEE